MKKIRETGLLEKARIKKLLGFTAEKAPQDTVYRNMTLEELSEMGRNNGVNVEELRDKYPNDNIYRMRLTMVLKKTVSK